MAKVTVVKADRAVVVDGTAFEVDTSSLPADFHALHFNTNTNQGVLETTDGVNTPITDITPYQSLRDAWQAAKDARDAAEAAHLAFINSPEQVAKRARNVDYDNVLAADTQLAALKSMTNAELEAWFDANVTNAAQAIGILKKVVKVLIRRVL